MTFSFRLFISRFLILFIIGFILTLPNNYYLLPDIGSSLSESVSSIVLAIFSEAEPGLYSDSSIMLLWTFLLIGLCFIIALILQFIRPKGNNDRLLYWLRTIASWYLALTLFKYGFNKLFNYQFFFPEPNTLYTPLGQLSPDILYWSSMGTSYSYAVFMGLIEIIPATLLLFRKTRAAGSLIAIAVLINVVMVNFGFGITVKIYSLFLLALAIIIFSPQIKRIGLALFSTDSIPESKAAFSPNDKKFEKVYPYAKTLVIGIILFESLAFYFSIGYFNGDNIPKPPLSGAYENVQSNGPKRIFFHSRNYFIIQSKTDDFIDYKSDVDTNNYLIELTDYSDNTCQLNYKDSAENFELTGSFFGTEVNWRFRKLELKNLPIYDN